MKFKFAKNLYVIKDMEMHKVLRTNLYINFGELHIAESKITLSDYLRNVNSSKSKD